MHFRTLRACNFWNKWVIRKICRKRFIFFFHFSWSARSQRGLKINKLKILVFSNFLAVQWIGLALKLWKKVFCQNWDSQTRKMTNLGKKWAFSAILNESGLCCAAKCWVFYQWNWEIFRWHFGQCIVCLGWFQHLGKNSFETRENLLNWQFSTTFQSFVTARIWFSRFSRVAGDVIPKMTSYWRHDDVGSIFCVILHD